MALTLSQLQVLKADIISRGIQAQPETVIAGVYNAVASPSFTVWKTRVTEQDMHAAYVWTEMDNLTQARFNQLTLILKPGSINPSTPNIRQGVQDIFTGAQLVNTRTALTALSKRLATVAEKLFSTGPGDGSNGNPANLVFEGSVSIQDVQAALSV